jgi:hypothetical protein
LENTLNRTNNGVFLGPYSIDTSRFTQDGNIFITCCVVLCCVVLCCVVLCCVLMHISEVQI